MMQQYDFATQMIEDCEIKQMAQLVSCIRKHRDVKTAISKFHEKTLWTCSTDKVLELLAIAVKKQRTINRLVGNLKEGL